MEKKSLTRFMKFIGSRDLIFILMVVILLGIAIFIYNKISFIFYPFIVIISTVAAPIILAFIAYYLMNPIVNLLERLHVKRIWGIIIIILGIAGLLTGIILLIAPTIQSQIKDLTSNFPNYLQQMSEGFRGWISHSFLGPFYDEGYEWVVTNLSDLTSKLSENLGGAMEGIRNVASTVTHFFVAIFTFPFILFFLLKDGTKFKEYCLQLIPPKNRKDVNQILHNMDVQVGSYIRGQIIVASCIGILLYIGYLIIGLDYAIILASFASVSRFFPYRGLIIALSLVLIVSFLFIYWLFNHLFRLCHYPCIHCCCYQCCSLPGAHYRHFPCYYYCNRSFTIYATETCNRMGSCSISGGAFCFTKYYGAHDANS